MKKVVGLIVIVIALLGVIGYLVLNKEASISFKQDIIEVTDTKELNMNDYLQLKNVDEEEVSFTSSDNEIVEVNNGKIIVKNEGEAIITAKYEDSEVNLTIKVSLEDEMALKISLNDLTHKIKVDLKESDEVIEESSTAKYIIRTIYFDDIKVSENKLYYDNQTEDWTTLYNMTLDDFKTIKGSDNKDYLYFYELKEPYSLGTGTWQTKNIKIINEKGDIVTDEIPFEECQVL